MPLVEKENAILADIVQAFSYTIVAICRALEEQQNIPTTQFSSRINLLMALEEFPTGSSGENIKLILTNIANELERKPVTPIHFQ